MIDWATTTALAANFKTKVNSLQCDCVSPNETGVHRYIDERLSGRRERRSI